VEEDKANDTSQEQLRELMKSVVDRATSFIAAAAMIGNDIS